MWIRRIEVRDFRALVGTTIVDCADLTVISGENEEGKSTLAAALRAVLFERHRVGGQLAESFQPFGSKLRPEVTLDFEIGGQGYRLRKAFCVRPEAELITSAGTWIGQHAERELEKLLRVKIPGRGPSKEDHQGIWGLLWAEQGRASEAVPISGDARTRLQSTLEKEVGAVLGGTLGPALLHRAAARYANSFDRRGLPRNERKILAAKRAEFEREYEALSAQLMEHEAEVDALSSAQAELNATWRAEAKVELERELKDRQEAHARANTLETHAEDALRSLRLAQAKLETSRARTLQRREAAADLEKARAAERERAQHAAQRKKQLEAAQQTRDAAAKQLAEAIATQERAQRSFEECVRARRLIEAQRKHARAHSRLRRARKLERAAQSARDAADAVDINEARLDSLRAARERMRTAEARLQSVATTISFSRSKATTTAGVTIAPGASFQFTEPTEFCLADGERVQVHPGGESLAAWREEAHATETDYANMLKATGFESLEAATEALRKRAAYLAEAQSANHQMRFVEAPLGIEALTREIQELADLSEALRAQADDASPNEQTLNKQTLNKQTTDEQVALFNEARAEQARDSATTEAQRQEQRTSTAETALRIAHQAWFEQDARHQAVAEQVHNLEERLATSREQTSDHELESKLVDEVARVEAARASVEKHLAASKASPSEETAKALRASQERQAKASDETGALERKVRELQIRLSASGHAGLGERLAELEAERAATIALHDRAEREALAASLLHRVLEEAAADAKQHLLEPIQARMRSLLGAVIGSAELDMDAELRVRGLFRTDRSEPFLALSVGTREQLAVMVRLAFADLLREAGSPTPIVLDDALVYSDATRFTAIKNVLQSATNKGQQILIFTCREDDWADVQGSFVRLEECRSATKPGAPPQLAETPIRAPAPDIATMNREIDKGYAQTVHDGLEAEAHHE